MTLLNRQRRLVEAGRLRLGEKTTKGGKTYPTKLEHWRLTSRDETKIKAAAAIYGGEPRPWKDRDGEFELHTETGSLDVYLLPGSLTQHYEMWGQRKAKGPVECLRRCDGVSEDLSDGPCLCDHETRYELAKEGKACKPTTRLSVILPGVPGIGSWLLVTRGENAADELAGMADLLVEVARRGEVVPARLRIDQRRSVVDGQTTVFNVPVLELDITPASVLAIAGGSGGTPGLGGGTTAELNPGATYTPVPATPQPTVSQGLDATAKNTEPRKTKQAPFGPRAPLPVPDAIPVDGDPPVTAPPSPASGSPANTGGEPPQGSPPPPDERPKITNQQRKLLFAKATEHGLEKADVRTAVERVTGQSSTAVIASDDLDLVLAELGTISADKQKQEMLG